MPKIPKPGSPGEDDNIDLSKIPELTPEEFARGIVRIGLKPVPRKVQLTLRLDADVLAWFKEQGKGYQTRMNAVLRAFKETYEEKIVHSLDEIPKFSSEDEEREWWGTHDLSEELYDQLEPERPAKPKPRGPQPKQPRSKP